MAKQDLLQRLQILGVDHFPRSNARWKALSVICDALFSPTTCPCRLCCDDKYVQHARMVMRKCHTEPRDGFNAIQHFGLSLIDGSIRFPSTVLFPL